MTRKYRKNGNDYLANRKELRMNKIQVYVTDKKTLVIDKKTLTEAESLNSDNNRPLSDNRTKGARHLKAWAESHAS